MVDVDTSNSSIVMNYFPRKYPHCVKAKGRRNTSLGQGGLWLISVLYSFF